MRKVSLEDNDKIIFGRETLRNLHSRNATLINYEELYVVNINYAVKAKEIFYKFSNLPKDEIVVLNKNPENGPLILNGNVTELYPLGINLNLFEYDRLFDKFVVKVRLGANNTHFIDLTKENLQPFIFNLYANPNSDIMVSISMTYFIDEYSYRKSKEKKEVTA